MSPPPNFSGDRVARFLVVCLMFYRSVFFLLSIFFWPLYCLSSDLRFLVTPLVSYLVLATLLFIEVQMQECERSCICVLRILICRFLSLVIIYTYRWNLYGMHTGFRYIEDWHIHYSWRYSKIVYIKNRIISLLVCCHWNTCLFCDGKFRFLAILRVTIDIDHYLIFSRTKKCRQHLLCISYEK